MKTRLESDLSSVLETNRMIELVVDANRVLEVPLFLFGEPEDFKGVVAYATAVVDVVASWTCSDSVADYS